MKLYSISNDTAQSYISDCVSSVSHSLGVNKKSVQEVVDDPSLVIRIKDLYDLEIREVMSSANSLLDYALLYHKVPTPYLEKHWTRIQWPELNNTLQMWPDRMSPQLIKSYKFFLKEATESVSFYIDLEVGDYYVYDYQDEDGLPNETPDPKLADPNRYMQLHAK